MQVRGPREGHREARTLYFRHGRLRLCDGGQGSAAYAAECATPRWHLRAAESRGGRVLRRLDAAGRCVREGVVSFWSLMEVSLPFDKPGRRCQNWNVLWAAEKRARATSIDASGKPSRTVIAEVDAVAAVPRVAPNSNSNLAQLAGSRSPPAGPAGDFPTRVG